MDLGAVWPYALLAVVVLAIVIIVVMVVLLRRSAAVSKFADAEEPVEEAPPAEEKIDPQEEEIAGGWNGVFRRARKFLRRTVLDDGRQVPLYLAMGAEGSREPSLFAAAGMDLPFGTPQEQRLTAGKARGFWFFERGVVIDAVGEQVLRADGKTADDAGWKRILHLLQSQRPKRPLDGLIVTLSCAELLDAAENEVARDELTARAARIYRKLWEAQQTLGFRLPAYIVITGCDKLTGFSSFSASLPHAAREEMLGWSNPYNADTAYRGAWPDEAMSSLATRLDDLQLEVYTAGTADADTLFGLPLAFRSLATPLRAVLDQLFKSSAYYESLMLRGIYFTGPTEAGVKQGTDAPVRTAFIKDLLDMKIFEESALATPTAASINGRNRAVAIARAATIAAAVLCTAAILIGKWRLDHENAQLVPLMSQTVDHLRAQGPPQAHASISDDLLERWSTDLLTGMAGIDFGHYGAIVVPSSWFSNFEHRVELALSTGFNRIILESLRLELEDDTLSAITKAAPHQIVAPPLLQPTSATGLLVPTSPNALASIPLTTTGNAEPSIDTPAAAGELLTASGPAVVPIDQMPEFMDLQRFVHEMVEIEATARTFNGIQYSGSLRDLATVVEHSYGKKLPQSFFSHAGLYEHAMREAVYDEFHPEAFRTLASERAAELAALFYAKLYERNGFALRLRQLSAMLQQATWQWPSAGESSRFAELQRRMQEVDTALSSPELEWAFKHSYELGPAYDQVINDLRNSQFFGADIAQKVKDSGAAGWQHFHSSLATIDSSMTGPLLATRDGVAEMQLSPDTLFLKSALETFLGQGFVASSGGNRRIQTDLPPGLRLQWDGTMLEQAASVAHAYDRFRDKTLARFPADLRTSIDQVARERARVQMVDLVAESQKYEQVPPAVAATMAEDDVRSGVAAFTAASVPINDVLDGFAQLRVTDARRDVALAMSAEALRLLHGVDRLLAAEGAYRPRQGTFNWWDGGSPVSPVAWGGRDPGDVAAYLDTTRGRVGVLARSYAQPLLAWFAKSGNGDRSDVKSLAGKWQSIIDDLREYDAKRPGNSVAVLEDYIATSMPKVGTNDCAAASLPASFKPSRGYFDVTLQDLARSLAGRCYSLAGRDASSRYAELSRYFNSRLAGRYPFADAPPKKGEPEADPDDVRGFFRLYDASQAVIRSMPTDGSAQAFGSARRFVEELAPVRAFFAPFLDAKKQEPLPAYDVEATFRVLRDREVDANQIIGWSIVAGDESVSNRDKKRKFRWSPGQPVQIGLRWASDSPRVPVLTAATRGAMVRDRTLTFEYGNRWSLLTALADHAASSVDLPQYQDVEPVTLVFSVYTQPAGGGPASVNPAQAFMRLSLLAPGTTQLIDVPKFPTRAPRLDGTVVAEDLQ